MKLCCMLLSMVLAGSAAAQSGDPFLGTWVYSVDKSPSPPITYAIKDLGGDRYALTGSSARQQRSKPTAASRNHHREKRSRSRKWTLIPGIWTGWIR